MAQGDIKTNGLKSQYSRTLLDHAADLDRYDREFEQVSLAEIREMTADEKQAHYIKLHWELMRFCASMRDKSDRTWRRMNRALLIKAEQEGLLAPKKEVALDNYLSANLILQECISNHSFWVAKVAMHSNIIAAEKNARDLLGIPYPGELINA